MESGNNRWASGLTLRDRRNSRPVATCALLWAASFLAARIFLPAGNGSPAAVPVWAWGLTLLPVLLGIGVALYYFRFVREADEMIRRIHLEALAIGFGVAFVVGMGTGLMAQIGFRHTEGIAWSLGMGAFALKLCFEQRKHNA